MNITYFHHFQFEVFLPVNFLHLQDQLNKLLNRQLFLQYFQPVRILNYGLISISLSIFIMKKPLLFYMMFMKENIGGFTFPHADQAEAKNDDAPEELEAFSLSAECFSLTASLFLSSSMFGFPSGCSHLTYSEIDN